MGFAQGGVEEKENRWDIPQCILNITALCGTTGAVRFFLFWQVFTRTAALSSILNRSP
jgi:hypothetical protein